MKHRIFQWLSPKTAGKLILGSCVPILVFHALVLSKIVPYQIAWGGRLHTEEEMVVFECISIGILMLFMISVSAQLGYRLLPLPLKWNRVLLWFFVILFSFNTIGNLMAVTQIEKLFALFTFMMAYFLVVLLIQTQKKLTPKL